MHKKDKQIIFFAFLASLIFLLNLNTFTIEKKEKSKFVQHSFSKNRGESDDEQEEKEESKCKSICKQRKIGSSLLKDYFAKETKRIEKHFFSNVTLLGGICKNPKHKKSLHFDLFKLKRSKKKLLVAVMLHNNEQVFPFWFSEFERLIQLLKPLSPFVSLLESHSKDLTPLWYPPPPHTRLPKSMTIW